MFQPREVTVDKVKFPKDDKDCVEFEFDHRSHWQGAKLKDFWRTEDWEQIIKTGTELRLWTIQHSIILGLQVNIPGKGWQDAWCAANDFQTKAEEKKMSDSYNDFIKKEGSKIADWIDAGKTLAQIDKLIDNGHSGNTYACALSIGIHSAKSKDKAEVIRKEHNSKHGYDNPKRKDNGGVVNPAIMTIG
jgi:hypothetical protein